FFENISLPKGVYQVSLYYSTDTYMKNICVVNNGEAGFKTLLTGGEHLYAGLDKTDFQMWLLDDSDAVQVQVVYGGEGSFQVHGLRIYETNALYRIYLFVLVLLCLGVNSCILFYQYDKAYKVSRECKNIIWALSVLILIVSLPLMHDSMIYSGDLVYHLMRIEGIKDGILAGQFPVRIAPKWLNGYGYASSIFYGETVMYIAAFFRLIGFSVVTSYKMFIFVLNVATVLIAYYCFQRIFKNGYIGLLCSALYSLSVYRIFKTFLCGSLGETLGVLFLPLIVYGFWRVFTENCTDAKYKKAWVPLTIGFTGLVQSHFLTGELVGFFTILLCLILWKKVLRPRTFGVLARTVIYTILLSAWFLVPFLDYMLRDDFVIQHVSDRTIQSRGLYPAHLLFTFFSNGTNTFFVSGGMNNSQPMGIGISLLVALLLWGGIWFLRKHKDIFSGYAALGMISWVFAFMAMCMSLSVFPWDYIQSLSSVTGTLVSSIQFPNRILTIATVLLTVVAGVVGKWILTAYKDKGFQIYCGFMGVLLLFSSIYLTNDMMRKAEHFQVYNAECMGTGYIAGEEYLPYGTDASPLLHRAPVVQESIVLEGYEKQGLRVRIGCYNTDLEEAFIELPLLYYRGYHAYDTDSGMELPVYKGTNNVLGVAVPGDYQGMFEVRFDSPWYWRCAELFSVFFCVLLLVGYRLGERKR
ncbi:MAG: hypothetical protein IJ327_07970, partial [Lachnospiraceae bacterium]|nr:hypothetical protein [Lachnospiraceae bacterium]